MYIFVNALKNIGRNKGRNILIGVILFVLIFATGISLIIHDSSTQVIEGYKNKFGANVILTRDNSKVPANESEYKEPNINMYEAFSKSSLLKSSTISASGAGSVLNAKSVNQGTVTGPGLNQESGRTSQSGYVSPNNMLIGINKEAAKTAYNSTSRKIVEGKIFENDNEVIVSQELAELNNWKVGEEITVTIQDLLGSKTNEFKVKISGFYVDTLPSRYENDVQTAFTTKQNQIVMALETLKAASTTGSDMLYVTAEFEIKNPSKITELEKEFRKAGLPEYFNVKADDSAYKSIVAPVENMTDITKTFVFAIVILGGTVLIILSSIAIRERKYEVGVLRAMGMKKGKISFGLLSEMLVITAIALSLGLGSAAIASKPVANTLFSTQAISAPQSSQGGNQANNGSTDMTGPFKSGKADAIEPVTTIQAGLSPTAAGQLTLISLLLASISSIAGILFVTRYEPAKILSERN